MPKFDIPKEWCEKMAGLEGDSPVTAGKPDPIMNEIAAYQAALLHAADLFDGWQKHLSPEPRDNFMRSSWCALGDALDDPIVKRLIGRT